jgi:hypothetical protein
MSKYCSKCGKEILEGASFCGGCGERIEIVSIDKNKCSNCGFTINPKEKFCSECGAQIIDKFSTSKDSVVKNENLTASKKQEVIPSKNTQPIKKKKRSFLGCLWKSLLFMILILVIGIVIIWNLPDDEKDSIIDTNIPGIVDIEDNGSNQDATDEKNSSIFQKNNSSEDTNNSPVIESNDISQITKSVESVFYNADTTRLKQLLTSTSLKMYKGSFSEIQPYMNEYSKAFKNRKLVHSSKIYALYSFKDEEGNEHTVEFANDGSGTWKLLHF